VSFLKVNDETSLLIALNCHWYSFMSNIFCKFKGIYKICRKIDQQWYSLLTHLPT